MLDQLSKYVYEVWHAKSVSTAAKNLFLSQPALSAAIKKAEYELGAPIFNRSTLPFSLTPEGKIYIEAIERIMAIESEAKHHILDINAMNKGTLTIGTATHLSYYVIPLVCEKFGKKYPNIDINIISTNTQTLPSMLEKKTADLIFISSEEDISHFETEALFEEKCIIAISKSYPNIAHLLPFALTYDEVVSRNYSDEKKISDFSRFDGIEFIYNAPNSNLYKKRKLFLRDSKISQHIISSSTKHQLNYNLMRVGFGALFTTDSAVATMQPSESCHFFAINAPEASRLFSIAHNTPSDAPAFPIITEFIKTAKMLFREEDPLALFSTIKR